MTQLITRGLVTLSCLLATGMVFAQTGGPSASETTLPQSKRPPEQAAIDACKDYKEGDRVYFTDAKGKKRHYACAMVDGVLAARSGVATPAKKK